MAVFDFLSGFFAVLFCFLFALMSRSRRGMGRFKRKRTIEECEDDAMAELTVTIPKELAAGSKQLKKEELNALVTKALKERLSKQLLFPPSD